MDGSSGSAPQSGEYHLTLTLGQAIPDGDGGTDGGTDGGLAEDGGIDGGGSLCTRDFEILCNDLLSHDSLTQGRNTFETYSCQPEYSESGNEVIYEFIAPGGCPQGWNVLARLSGMGALDLDLWLLESCDPDSCLDHSAGTEDEVVLWSAHEGESYHLAVDGFGGVSGPYDLALVCACGGK